MRQIRLFHPSRNQSTRDGTKVLRQTERPMIAGTSGTNLSKALRFSATSAHPACSLADALHFALSSATSAPRGRSSLVRALIRSLIL
jgi:hypothetical protein